MGTLSCFDLHTGVGSRWHGVTLTSPVFTNNPVKSMVGSLSPTAVTCYILELGGIVVKASQ